MNSGRVWLPCGNRSLVSVIGLPLIEDDGVTPARFYFWAHEMPITRAAAEPSVPEIDRVCQKRVPFDSRARDRCRHFASRPREDAPPHSLVARLASKMQERFSRVHPPVERGELIFEARFEHQPGQRRRACRLHRNSPEEFLIDQATSCRFNEIRVDTAGFRVSSARRAA